MRHTFWLAAAALGIRACGESSAPTDVMLASRTSLSSGAVHESDAGRAAVYTLSNSTGGNAVIAFTRGSDGGLAPAGTYAKGGNGTGSGLGSQGAVILSKDGGQRFAVNAGSSSITGQGRESRYRSSGEVDDAIAAIQAALEETGGALGRSAELLGMGRTTLWRKLRVLGIKGCTS